VHQRQRLSTQGKVVCKLGSNGRVSKKLFRFSFVEGKIYLTWKGKSGNQGIDLHDLTRIVKGLGSPVLQRYGKASRAGRYLSLQSSGDRAIDLYFGSDEECDQWATLMKPLVNKERGNLPPTIPSVVPNKDSTDFDWLTFERAVGPRQLLQKEGGHMLNRFCSKVLPAREAGTAPAAAAAAAAATAAAAAAAVVDAQEEVVEISSRGLSAGPLPVPTLDGGMNDFAGETNREGAGAGSVLPSRESVGSFVSDADDANSANSADSGEQPALVGEL
jgi:hypothetical protein